MKKQSLLLVVAFLVGSLACAVPDAAAKSYYTNGHTDIGLEYEDGELIPHWHLAAGNIVNGEPLPGEEEFSPEDLVAVFAGTRASAAGSADYLGVATGTTIYMGGPSAGWQPYLGFGTEELDPGDWIGPIKLTLTGWSLPPGGNFALYTTNFSGTTTVDLFLSTYNPSIANIDGVGENAFHLIAGGHDHFTFGFTAPGDYELTFQFDAVHAIDGPVSGSGTFGFQVIPEPSTYALVVISGIALLLWRRRSQRLPS